MDELINNLSEDIKVRIAILQQEAERELSEEEREEQIGSATVSIVKKLIEALRKAQLNDTQIVNILLECLSDKD